MYENSNGKVCGARSGWGGEAGAGGLVRARVGIVVTQAARGAAQHATEPAPSAPATQLRSPASTCPRLRAHGDHRFAPSRVRLEILLCERPGPTGGEGVVAVEARDGDSDAVAEFGGLRRSEGRG